VASADRLPVQVAAEEEWVSVSMAARMLGVSADTVRRLLENGRLRGARTVLGRVVDPASVTEEAARRGR
jgi:excisionase family DNA binding protein